LTLRRFYWVLNFVAVVIGIFIFSHTQIAFAKSNTQVGGSRTLGGGRYDEQLEQINFNANDLINPFDDLVVPPRGQTQTFATSLPQIRIMPLGDSITKGTGTCSLPDTYLNCIGYREDLWNGLASSGNQFNFVGTQGAAFQNQYTFDNDHEGHGGWTATDIKGNIYGSGLNWLNNNPADIILLHIGTNDLGGIVPPNVDQQISNIVTDVEGILNKIDQFETDNNRGVLVVLARIINRSDPNSAEGVYTTTFNGKLQLMANNRIAGGDKLAVVNMEAALIYPDDLGDDLHPNAAGYSKMADVWLAALEQIINLPPTILNPGDQSSVQNQIVSLEVQASDPEDDALVFSATGLPPGLTINQATGEIHGKISNAVMIGAIYPVTITADDQTGFPDSDSYNKTQMTFNWKIGESVLLPLVVR
jgi:lysophospholipase L1-like esterase